MSKRLVNNSTLVGWLDQAEALINGTEMQPDPPLMGFLVEGRIEEFRKKNFVRITATNEKLNKMAAKYFEVDANGQVIYTDPQLLDGEGKKQKSEPKLLPGMTMEAYQEELKEFMSKKVEIFI